MGAGTSIDGPTCDATKHRSRNGSRVGPGNCTNGERTSKTEPFEFDCLAARFLQSGLLAVDPHHVVVPIAGVGVPRTAKRIAGGDRTGPSGRQRIRPPALLRVRLRPRHAALVSHLCSRCHRDHGRAKTLRTTLAPSSRKRLAVPDVPFSRNLSPSTLDEAQQAVNVRRLCQAGADVLTRFPRLPLGHRSAMPSSSPLLRSGSEKDLRCRALLPASHSRFAFPHVTRVLEVSDHATHLRMRLPCRHVNGSVTLTAFTAVFVLLLALASVPWHPAVASDATDPTSVASLAITSNPGPDQYYLRGEPIEVTVTFSGSVTVTGTPGLTLEVGNGTTLAIYQRGSGTTALVFVWNWNLWQLGEDHEGVSIPAGTILLREGSIQDDSGNAVDLAHTGLPTQSGHKVDDVNPALIAALTRATENTVTMFWDEVLDGNHVPPASGFDVRKLVSIGTFSEQEPISVTHVAVSGNSVTLTFATEVEAGLFVTARYGYLPFDRPLSIRELVAGSPYLRDRAGNPAYNVRASARVSGTPPTSGPNLTSVTVVSDPAPPPRGSSYWIGSGEYFPTDRKPRGYGVRHRLQER